MRHVQDTILEQHLYERLRAKYANSREGIHLTDLIYCLTKAWFEKHDTIPLTDRELGMFAVGFGLEEVLLRDPNAPVPESVEFLGIKMTPDYALPAEPSLGLDLKSTAMYPAPDGSPKRGWPQGWLMQMQMYAFQLWRSRHPIPSDMPEEFEYAVAILYLVPRELKVLRLYFAQEEVTGTLAILGLRLATLQTGRMPKPFTTNWEWECEECRYLLRCRSLAGGKG